MDLNEKVQSAINTLTMQRNQALNTIVEQQVRVSELEGDLAAANAKLAVALEAATEKKAKPIKHRP